MTRVLHLITTLKSGGAQAMLANLVTAANARRSTAHVVVEMTGGGEVGERIRRGGIPLHSLGMTRGRISTSAAGRFAQLLRRERPSLVQTWLYHADLLGLLALPVLRVPLVWNVRCAWHVGIRALAPRACARLSGLPAAVIVNSRAGQRVHEELGYRPRRWCLISNGFDLDVFKPDQLARLRVRAELGLPPETRLIGLVGRWDPNKDHATFLAAAGLLARRSRDVHFVLVGEGLTAGNAALAELLKATDVPAQLHLLGNRTDVSAVTAALDIASCTSIGEGFPNVVGEAMAAAVPCVTTDVGDAAQLVGDPQLIVPTRNPAALAEAWWQLLSMDAAALRARGAAGRARIAKYYSLGGVIAQYQSLYEELQSAPHRRLA
jgi:glycosyltransferase involved in cell wall biosynthesis